MRKNLIRASGLGAAFCGLAVAFAPAAGAATFQPARPVIQRFALATSHTVTDPCNGAAVSTSGHGHAVTVTRGQHTTIAVTDTESGGGFIMSAAGFERSRALSATYPVHAEGLWIDPTDPTLDFRASITVTVDVSSANAPVGYTATLDSTTCGL